MLIATNRTILTTLSLIVFGSRNDIHEWMMICKICGSRGTIAPPHSSLFNFHAVLGKISAK